MAELLRQKVKYVFVIFNENESFDHEYGTFPGVNGLYSDGQKPRSAADTPGFTQTYTDVNGAQVTLQPFRIGPQQNATFADSTDHSHTGLAAKLDVVDGVPKMDGFAKDEYTHYAKVGNPASQGGRHAISRGHRHGACRLRYDSVLLAICKPLHDLRQYFRDRGHAFLAECHRHDRRPVGRNAMG